VASVSPKADESVRGTTEPEPPRYLNRHLSWLEFEARVLSLAEDPVMPLLERVKFLAIFGSNMDEFFQVRVAELDEQADAGITVPSPDGLTPADQLRRIRSRTVELVERAGRVFQEEIRPGLAAAGIAIVDWDQLDRQEQKFLAGVYDDLIVAVLTPLAVDPAHPFPYISNLSLNLAVVVQDPETAVRRFARIKVPPLLPRFVAPADGARLVPVEQVIAAHLDALFPGMEIVEHHPFRVTRNQDPDLGEDEGMDLRAAVERVLQRRRRSHHAVRLEIRRDMPGGMRDMLVRELDLEPGDVDVGDGLLDLGSLWDLYEDGPRELKHDEWPAVTQARLAGDGADLFAVLRDGDVLVHHPYDAFATSVAAFIDQAARDPDVQAIKQTLYRTSGTDSGIVAALIRAAEAGKQVVALVELTARFDEERNIAWAGALEKAGAHVVYGVVGLKTHAKVSLVVRREPDGIHRYCHVGTGNYNSTTARVYEDIGLLTADEAIGDDVADLFNYLTGYSRKEEYRRLVVAPFTLRSSLEQMIREQAREGGRIVLKANGLTDPQLVDELYRASSAGAEIDLVLRSHCCLVPGVPGRSERIRVRSVVGRFLEHSRLLRFGSGDDSRYYIGSGDLMPRNLDRRVEALVPIDAPGLRARLDEIIGVYLSEDVACWVLGSDGMWNRRDGADPQRSLHDLARGHAAG
jgi:polyphosphate kinase